jgi:uncharacterized protein YjlB
MTNVKRRPFSRALAMGAVAGTGHRSLEASTDFLVVGAYPPDRNRDICRDAPAAVMTQRMNHLAFPGSDR